MATKITSKKPNFGNSRSKALNITKKKQNVNSQKITINGQKVVTSVREARTFRKNNSNKKAA